MTPSMDIALKKLDLVERLLSIWDEAALERVAKVIEQETVDEDDEVFTKEELAELDRRHARYLSGESKPHTVEESMRLARGDAKG